MLDRNLMKKVVNKVYNTDEFKKAEAKRDKYQKISKNADNATIAIGVPLTVGTVALVCSDNLSVEQMQNLATGAAVGLGTILNPVVISTITQRKAFNQQQKILNLIKDEYVVSCMEQNLVENGYIPEKARQRAELDFENMSKEDKEKSDKDFNKMLKIYEIEEEKPFNYNDFVGKEIEKQESQTANIVDGTNEFDADSSEMGL